MWDGNIISGTIKTETVCESMREKTVHVNYVKIRKKSLGWNLRNTINI